MSQTIHDLLASGVHQLKQTIPNLDQRWFEVELVLASLLKHDRVWLMAHGEKKLSSTQTKRFDKCLKRRQNYEPLAYILGRWSFYGREFLLDRRALIPRPETELMIERALRILKRDDQSPLLWDVGTGCGTIAITLAKEIPHATIIASDISRSVLNLAQTNARHLKAKGITFIQANLLNQNMTHQLDKADKKSLMILANLPYLPLVDQKKLAPNVIKYEPKGALFTKQNGLFLIRQLLKQLSQFQKKNQRSVTVLLEFDPPQIRTLPQLVKKYFPHVTLKIHQDLCGRDRLLELLS